MRRLKKSGREKYNMHTYILDTNVLVRFLVGDHKEHQESAERWFASAENGKITIVIDPVVIAETTFVLESFYKLKRDHVADAMEVFLSQRWLEVRERESLLNLWHFYREGLHFVDSYCLAWAQNAGASVLSFDKKMKGRSR